MDELNSTYSQSVAYDAALQGMVLLKNNEALPLKAGMKLAVVGPMGNTTQLLFSDYETAGFDNDDTIFSHLSTVNTGGTTTFEEGVSVTGGNTTAESLASVSAADVTILAIGLVRKL